MYDTQIEKFAAQAVNKYEILKSTPLSIFIGGLLAGAYIGFGIILIMTLGSEVPASAQKLVMGATFGIALTLVMFSGAELFTGYTMYCTLAVLQKKQRIANSLKICAYVWLANLVGAVLLVALYKLGNGQLMKSADTVLHVIAYKKMNGGAIQLFVNGILCNWLVCLAIWTCARVTSDSAKCIVIFWCLFAFIACGFEHSVANMTVFSLALMGPAVEGISLSGAAWNLGLVTLGNAVGGSLFVAASYWRMSKTAKA